MNSAMFVEDVADPNTLRRGTAPTQPSSTLKLGDRPAAEGGGMTITGRRKALWNPEKEKLNETPKSPLERAENIFSPPCRRPTRRSMTHSTPRCALS
jgi:hypothetical protein